MFCAGCGFTTFPGDVRCRRCGVGLKPKGFRWGRLGAGLAASAAIMAAFGAGVQQICPMLGHAQSRPGTALADSGQAITTLAREGGAGIPVAAMPEGSSSPVLSILEQPAAPTLAASMHTGEPVTQKPQTETTMPADVRDWLEHLARIEQARQDLAGEQAGRAAALMADLQANGGGRNMAALAGGDEDAIPTSETRRTGEARNFTDDLRAPWRALEQRFASVPPPAECAGIAQTFAGALEETGAMMAEVSSALAKSEDSPQAALQVLYAMQGRSASRIDRPLKNVDGGVQDLCAKYSVRKWFDVGESSGGFLAKM